MKNNTNSIISIIVSFLLVVLLSFIPKTNYGSKLVSETNVKNSLKTISTSVGDDYIQIDKQELSSDIIFILYENVETEEYKSFFIDKTSGRVLDYKSLFKSC